MPFEGDAKIRNDKQKYDFTSDNRTKCVSTIDQSVLCSFVLFVANTVVCVFGKIHSIAHNLCQIFWRLFKMCYVLMFV